MRSSVHDRNAATRAVVLHVSAPRPLRPTLPARTGGELEPRPSGPAPSGPTSTRLSCVRLRHACCCSPTTRTGKPSGYAAGSDRRVPDPRIPGRSGRLRGGRGARGADPFRGRHAPADLPSKVLTPARRVIAVDLETYTGRTDTVDGLPHVSGRARKRSADAGRRRISGRETVARAITPTAAWRGDRP